MNKNTHSPTYARAYGQVLPVNSLLKPKEPEGFSRREKLGAAVAGLALLVVGGVAVHHKYDRIYTNAQIARMHVEHERVADGDTPQGLIEKYDPKAASNPEGLVELAEAVQAQGLGKDGIGEGPSHHYLIAGQDIAVPIDPQDSKNQR